MQTKQDIAHALGASFDKLEALMLNLTPEQLISPINDGWSALQQFDHLILSNKPINVLLSIPKPALYIYGTASKPSRSYDEVVAFYKEHLAKGAKATGDFVPEVQNADKLEATLLFWRKLRPKLVNGVLAWDEKELDKYRAPHPILGKLTVRELLYFTIYHNAHHTEHIGRIQ